MKFKKFFLSSIIVITLSGCNYNDSSKINTAPDDSNHISNSEGYTTIREFQELLAENLKNGFLDINVSKEYISLSMELFIEKDLMEKLQNTTNAFSFNFDDITGNMEISNSLLHQPKVLNGNLIVKQLNENNNQVKITQYLPLQKNLDINQIDYLKKPENYEFQILDENGDRVFILAGLDISTLDNQ